MTFWPRNVLALFERLPERRGGFQDVQVYLASRCGRLICAQCNRKTRYVIDTVGFPWWECGWCKWARRAEMRVDIVEHNERMIERILRYRSEYGDGGFESRLEPVSSATIVGTPAQQGDLFGGDP